MSSKSKTQFRSASSDIPLSLNSGNQSHLNFVTPKFDSEGVVAQPQQEGDKQERRKARVEVGQGRAESVLASGPMLVT